MASILQNEAIDKLPVVELSDSLDLFLVPVMGAGKGLKQCGL